MTAINRRQFVSTLAATTAMVAAKPISLASEKPSSQYSFLLLGDTHFDRKEHHDFEWMQQNFAKSIPQVENYSRHTIEKLPALLNHAKQRFAKSDSPQAFTLHVGDLVQGICGNEKLATQHCQVAWEFFQSVKFNVPLLMTKGNHDITGPGAVEAFEKVLIPATARELGRDALERTSYSFTRGNDLFAVFDSYDRTAIDWLEELASQNEFRRLFVLTHMPVVPYNARSSWIVYSNVKLEERRQRLINLLGKHQAIVLCGHLHKHCLLKRSTSQGSFLQLGISSVLKQTPPKRELLFNQITDYGPQLTNQEPNFSPDSLMSRQQILIDEKPFIQHFEYSLNSGFSILSVTPQDVVIDLYCDTKGNLPWRTISLSKLA